jgi:hypothetical protein
LHVKVDLNFKICTLISFFYFKFPTEESKQFIDLLKKAQNHSLDDQRGRIDSQHLEIPEFLLSHNLIKSHSKSQNIINHANNLNDSSNFKVYKDLSSAYTKRHLTNLNKSTMSLPISASGFLNNNNNNNNNHDTSITSNISIASSSKMGNLNFKSNTLSRSRSPIVIVYDNEDYNLDKTDENVSNISQNLEPITKKESFANISNQYKDNYLINHNNYMNILKSPVNNYESISETNTPVKTNKIKTAQLILDESKNSNQLKSVSVTSLEQKDSDNRKINSKISYV